MSEPSTANPAGGSTTGSFLLTYAYVADILERRAPHRAGHLERIAADRATGRLLIAGAVGDPPHGGAFGFTGVSREFVEQWVAADPYVVAGLVTEHSIEPWTLV